MPDTTPSVDARAFIEAANNAAMWAALNAAALPVAATTLSASISVTLGTSGILVGGTNLIEQRNGTAAQTHRWYSSHTDVNNSESLSLGYVGGNARWEMGPVRNGTGVLRPFQFNAGEEGGSFIMDIAGAAAGIIRFGKAGVSNYWVISDSGHFLAGTNNTYDIGASGATSPRSIYFGTSLFRGSTKVLGAQAAAVADATDNPSAITQLNDLLAKLRAHGLIAT